MQPGKYDRSIEMMCPTCGGKTFSGLEPESPMVTCSSCGLSLARDDLRQANETNIAAALDDVKNEVVADLRQTFRNAFKGNKNFRIK
jgi:hypothetical protein